VADASMQFQIMLEGRPAGAGPQIDSRLTDRVSSPKIA
jgi:hypothetical protein